MGWSGLTTLLLSFAVITATGGLTFLLCWAIVIKFARLRPADSAGADVILVLGVRLNRGETTREFETRLARAAQLGAAQPLVVLGGMAAQGGPSEAAAGQAWLLAQGVEPDRIIKEEASRNTLENLVHARDLMRRNGFRRPVLVTSRVHLARASILARGLGIEHQLSASDYPPLRHPVALARSLYEALMINWYYVGRAVARLTRSRVMLARIS